MGALLGVGLGSEKESRLLCMKWNGGEAGQRPMAFVGKGVTFDTGGISIKPGPGMWDMKWDMGRCSRGRGRNGRHRQAAGQGQHHRRLRLVENMPDGRAQRPGDIVTSMSGQTIEVLNTDAEGRLVLCERADMGAEGIRPRRDRRFRHAHRRDDHCARQRTWRAVRQRRRAGRQIAERRQGQRRQAVAHAAGSAAYDKLIDSPIADMKNIGPRGAGSITAAQFLGRFIDKDRPWAHCDIAGMVFDGEARPDLGQGRDRIWRAHHRQLRPRRAGGLGFARASCERFMKVDFWQLSKDPAERSWP